MKSKKILAMVIAVAMVVSVSVGIEKMTNAPIGFVGEPALAWITPGINSREGNGSLAIGANVLNTSVGLLEYMTSGTIEIQVNGDLTWGASKTYYLYYPSYTGRYGGSGSEATYNLTWMKYEGLATGAYAPQILTSSAGTPTDDTFGAGANENDVRLNCSGLWLIDDDTVHDVSTYARMTATVPAWFWVNTSTDFTLTATATTFKYGAAGSVTFNVTQTTGGTTPTALLAVHNTSGKLVGTWNDNQPFTNGIKTINKNSSVFTNAGTWYAMAYYDLDGGSGVAGSHVTYLDAPNGSGYDWYNKSLYGNGTTVIETQADQYSYEFGGPWDPPEYNSTPLTITVSTGQPTITLTNATPVYWGFDLHMDVNVTDANGEGIGSGIIKLRKSTGTALYYRGNVSGTPIDFTRWFINESSNTGDYTIEMPRADPLSGTNWTDFSNGTWKVFFTKDSNGDSVEEYNNSKSFSVSSRTRAVDLKITNDGYSTRGTATDNKIDVPDSTSHGPGKAGPADVVPITFRIYGRSVTRNRAYYGDGVESHPEDYKNITITGDILYPPIYEAAPPDTNPPGNNYLINLGNGYWTVNVTPTKPGGSITIAFNWPGANNGSDSETISIINGTHVATNIPSFTYGAHVNITVTVTSQQNIVENNAAVHVFWEGGTLLNDTANQSMTPATNGEYTFWIKPSEQGTTAPRNITIAAKTAGTTRWGYTSVKMEKNHNLVVNATPTTSYAGNPTLYDITVKTVDGVVPASGNAINVKLYKMDGTLVTGDDAWSNTAGQVTLSDQEIPLSGGIYQLYAYNNTHDSEGHNVTITVTKYTVISTPSVLAWLIDTSTNMTFGVNSPITNGTLTINNMSSTPNASHLGNSHDIIIENGVGTLTGVNATTLGNLTFEYTPDGGYSRHANGKVPITTATAIATPGTIYVGESTEVTIELLHPDTTKADRTLPGVLVGIDEGVNLTDSILSKIPTAKKTGTDGKVIFGIKAEATGNATIYIKSGTDPNNPQVIKAAIRKTMTITRPASVKEGGTFDVEIKDANGNYVTTPVTIEFDDKTNTTTTGKITLTAPDVSESLDYTIEASAEGYTGTQKDIKVINVPALQISTDLTVKAGETYEIAISNKDTGIGVVGATITITHGGETSTYTTKAGGVLTVTAPCTTGDYTITATFGTFQSATFTVTITGECEEEPTPGFELLTLIAAIGVAFILLRRRRRK